MSDGTPPNGRYGRRGSRSATAIRPVTCPSMVRPMALDGQINGLRLSKDRGSWVRAPGPGPSNGVGVHLKLPVDQIDDPVDRDPRATIVVALLAAVSGQAALRNLDDQADIPRVGMAIGVIIAVAADHAEVRLRLVVIGDPHRALKTEIPTGGKNPLDLSPAAREAGVVSRSFRHLPHHNPIQEFDRIILTDGAVADHPVVLFDGEPIHFARGRERHGELRDRGHDVRSQTQTKHPPPIPRAYQAPARDA